MVEAEGVCKKWYCVESKSRISYGFPLRIISCHAGMQCAPVLSFEISGGADTID